MCLGVLSLQPIISQAARFRQAQAICKLFFRSVWEQMFQDARRLKQDLFFGSFQTQALDLATTGVSGDGVFTVNYNLDEEPAFDDDVNSKTYGNYKNLWCVPWNDLGGACNRRWITLLLRCV